MKLDDLLSSLGGRGSLRQRLDDVCATSGVQGAAIALVGEDDCHVAAVGGDGSGEPFSAATAVSLSCAVKLFVTALVAPLTRGEVDVDDPILRHVDVPSAERLLAGTSIRHLLNHTDGIGYRQIDSIPMARDGFVDLDELGSVIASDERSFAPGAYCTDTHCGFGLLAALIERFTRRPFAETLRSELLRHIARPADAPSAASAARGPICPASGAGLALSATELGEFLRLHLDPRAFDIPLLGPIDGFSMLFEQQVGLPGWAPSTTGCALGWKTFAGGWVGHTGISERHTLFLRLHPWKAIGVAFLCHANAPAAYGALGGLLGELLPEIKVRNSPRLLTDGEQNDIRIDKYVGSFGNKGRRIVVNGDSASTLLLTTTSGGGRAAPPAGSGMLQPAADDSFFIRRPNTSGMFFVQYLKSRESPELDMLWDIRALWRRNSASALGHPA